MSLTIPWQSYLHRNDIKDLWAISCDPPLHLLNDPDAYNKLPHYMDESDYLYENILSFIHKNFPHVFKRMRVRIQKAIVISGQNILLFLNI